MGETGLLERQLKAGKLPEHVTRREPDPDMGDVEMTQESPEAPTATEPTADTVRQPKTLKRPPPRVSEDEVMSKSGKSMADMPPGMVPSAPSTSDMSTRPPVEPMLSKSGKVSKGGKTGSGSSGSGSSDSGDMTPTINPIPVPVPLSPCDKRLDIAFEALSVLPGFENPDFPLPQTPEDIATEVCAFDGVNSRFNTGCGSVLFAPDAEGNLGFLDPSELFVDIDNADLFVAAFDALILYCDCRAAYELGCAAKIPSGDDAETLGEFCLFGAVWNGDVPLAETELEEDVVDCGCFWIGQVTDEVDNCPGVELGAFFNEEPTPGCCPIPMEEP